MTATFKALRNQSPLVPKVGNVGKYCIINQSIDLFNLFIGGTSSLIHSFIYLLIYSLIHSLVASVHLFIHSFIHFLTYSFIYSFIRPVLQWLLSVKFVKHSFIYSVTHFHIYSFFHSFVHSFVGGLPFTYSQFPSIIYLTHLLIH